MDESEKPSSIGKLLREHREEVGLSLYELAKRSGVDRAKLLRLETGEIRQPTTETLNKLALALDIEPEELYDALWQDSNEPLPSPAIYFRSKYHLSDEQIKELKSSIDKVTRTDEAVDDS